MRPARDVLDHEPIVETAAAVIGEMSLMAGVRQAVGVAPRLARI